MGMSAKYMSLLNSRSNRVHRLGGFLVGPRLHLGSTRRAMDAILEAKKLETL